MDAIEQVREKIAETLGVPVARVADEAVLTDLVASSFLLVETVIELQEEFDVRFQQADLSEVNNVAQLLDLVAGRMAEKEAV